MHASVIGAQPSGSLGGITFKAQAVACGQGGAYGAPALQRHHIMQTAFIPLHASALAEQLLGIWEG